VFRLIQDHLMFQATIREVGSTSLLTIRAPSLVALDFKEVQ